MVEANPFSKVIRSRKDAIEHIQFPSEQAFAILLLDKVPHMEIIYEPRLYSITDACGKIIVATLPDFELCNPVHPDKKILIELSIAKRGCSKGKQRRVMREVAPDERYIVFNRRKLLQLKRKFPLYPLTARRKILWESLEVA